MSEVTHAPRWTGRIRHCDADQKLLPWSLKTDNPLWVYMQGCDNPFLILFSTEEKLRIGMEMVAKSQKTIEQRVSFSPAMYGIKQVDDGDDFLSSIWEQMPEARVIVDPYETDEGKTRWTEIAKDAATLAKYMR